MQSGNLRSARAAMSWAGFQQLLCRPCSWRFPAARAASVSLESPPLPLTRKQKRQDRGVALARRLLQPGKLMKRKEPGFRTRLECPLPVVSSSRRRSLAPIRRDSPSLAVTSTSPPRPLSNWRRGAGCSASPAQLSSAPTTTSTCEATIVSPQPEEPLPMGGSRRALRT